MKKHIKNIVLVSLSVLMMFSSVHAEEWISEDESAWYEDEDAWYEDEYEDTYDAETLDVSWTPSESGNAQEEQEYYPSLWEGTHENLTVEIGDHIDLTAILYDEYGDVVDYLKDDEVKYTWYRGQDEMEVIEGEATNRISVEVTSEMINCTKTYYFICSAMIQDTEIESSFALITEHKAVVDPGYPATSTSTGMTDGSHCSICGEVLKKQTVIPKITADTPVLVGVKVGLDSLTVTWNPSERAEGYAVYRKSNGGTWVTIARLDPTETSYEDQSVVNNASYLYTVRCLASDKTTTMSSFDPYGVGALFMKAPTITSIINTASGPKITLSAVDGAERYRIYRKTGEEGWKGIVTTTALSYIDTTAEAGVEYVYTARAANSAGVVLSSYDQIGKSIFYLATPKLLSATTSYNDVLLKWAASPGVKQYYVYRRLSTQKGWTRIGTTSDTYLRDTDVSNGTTYFYTVRAAGFDGTTLSYYDTTGIGCLYYRSPQLVSTANVEAGIRVTWNAVPGCTQYYVYRKTDDTSWKGIGKTSGTSYTDATAVSGENYTYTVRGMNSAGKLLTSYDPAGISEVRIGTGRITSIVTYSTGLRVTWEKIEGAQSYRIYRADGSGSYKLLATELDPNKVVYADFAATTNGLRYKYAIRAQIDGKYGAFVAKDTYYLSTPVIGSAKNSTAGAVSVVWNHNNKASGYQVYVQYGSAKTTKTFVGTNTSNGTITGLVKGRKYTFYVRSYYKNASGTYFSHWSDPVNVQINK